MNKEFLSWLGHAGSHTCMIENAGTTYYFVRVQKNEDFDYLYCQRQYSGKELARGGTFKYVGIFCRKDGELYDAQYDVQGLAGEDTRERGAGQLRENLRQAVRRLVEAAVANDRCNLQITELSDPELLRKLKNEQDYYAKSKARERFLDAAEYEPPIFRCYYEPEYWSEDSLLSYILDPKGYADTEAAEYMAAHQQDMLFDFLHNDAVRKEYQAIVADTANPVHFIKKIKAAMEATPAKTVNVTIRKDGTEFTFKTEASSLRGDCGSHYNSWNLVAADQRKFEQLFGRSADYTPQEIVRITYARNVLYEAEG